MERGGARPDVVARRPSCGRARRPARPRSRGPARRAPRRASARPRRGSRAPSSRAGGGSRRGRAPRRASMLPWRSSSEREHRLRPAGAALGARLLEHREALRAGRPRPRRSCPRRSRSARPSAFAQPSASRLPLSRASSVARSVSSRASSVAPDALATPASRVSARLSRSRRSVAWASSTRRLAVAARRLLVADPPGDRREQRARVVEAVQVVLGQRLERLVGELGARTRRRCRRAARSRRAARARAPRRGGCPRRARPRARRAPRRARSATSESRAGGLRGEVAALHGRLELDRAQEAACGRARTSRGAARAGRRRRARTRPRCTSSGGAEPSSSATSVAAWSRW